MNMTADSTNADPNKADKKRRTLMVTLAIFAAPFLVAAFFHLTGLWASVGRSNSGDLLLPPLEAPSLGLEQPLDSEGNPLWAMVYFVPGPCDDACTNTLTLMHQVRTSLGPESRRVALLAITPDGKRDSLAIADDVTVVGGDAARLREALKPHGDDNPHRLFLMDPMGAVFMVYPVHADVKDSILKGRGVLRDLRHVLKLSKIG